MQFTQSELIIIKNSLIDRLNVLKEQNKEIDVALNIKIATDVLDKIERQIDK